MQVVIAVVTVGLGICTLVVAIGALLMGAINSGKQARVTDIQTIQGQLAILQTELRDERQRHSECERRLEDITRINTQLMREMIQSGINPSITVGVKAE